MKAWTLLTLLLCAGCAAQRPSEHDFFARQSEFAAARAQEAVTLPATSYEAAYVHVVEVLMDLDCTLKASNRQLGVISATGAARLLPPESFVQAPQLWHGCAGHRVTVTVREVRPNVVLVRAAFAPPTETAKETFRTLLRRSLPLDATQAVQRAR